MGSAVPGIKMFGAIFLLRSSDTAIMAAIKTVVFDAHE